MNIVVLMEKSLGSRSRQRSRTESSIGGIAPMEKAARGVSSRPDASKERRSNANI
jgi:hypothetical protein